MNKLITSDQKRMMKIIDFNVKLENFIIYLKDKENTIYIKLISNDDVFLNVKEVFSLKNLFDIYLRQWIMRKYNLIEAEFNDGIFDWIERKINTSLSMSPYFDELFLYYNLYSYLILSESSGLYLYNITINSDHDRHILDDIRNGRIDLISETSTEQINVLNHLANRGFIEIHGDKVTPTFKFKHLSLK